MGDNPFKIYDVVEHMLYYHTGPYLGVYLQGQGHFGHLKCEQQCLMCKKLDFTFLIHH
jgi:hypothetical protein